MASSSSLASSAVVVLVISLMVCHAQSATQHAPAPAVDCSSLILNMADCLSYVSNGSTVEKPEGTCCAGLKTVLKTDAACLCETFKSSAQLGIVLNVTKSATLPAACGVSAPSAAKCVSLSPTSVPALSPSDQTTTPAVSAPMPDSGISGANAPSPTPGSNGGASGRSISVGSIVVALVVASFSSF